ncbi:centrosomal protein of 131 kDa isoform X2 [Orussus abietinus]|uniref:centrosomal protein of 131 kDa isoform X2 n=1 Tax=Orussus abietinus TaxID=222816 RepID=UPI000C7162D8|nr:centrosomal protein of 131 kDa isoform X2 [Orussus abietinus]
MINIVHPRTSSKPPIKKCNGEKGLEKVENCQERRTENLSSDSCNVEYKESTEMDSTSGNTPTPSMDVIIEDIGDDVESLQTNGDCNQSVIEPNTCSFEQLCNMIGDLEQDMNDKVSGIKNTESEICTKHSSENVVLQEKYPNQVEPEREFSKKACNSTGSTYDDIMSFLGTLEQDGHLIGCHINRYEVQPKNVIQDLFSSNQCYNCSNCNRNDITRTYVSSTLQEDLATTRLQLEEREATITVLKTELKTERQSACEKLESQRKEQASQLEAQKSKYQSIIKRHQKFIEKLISEKKDLSERCTALAERIKEMEAKYQRESKVTAERHAVEIQRAKDICAASEKIRRERWLEAKTSKIKEMTVKGLEPELRSMVEQHQQEIQEIRSAHAQELQDVELRCIRRSNQQLEQLRLELTAGHEKMLASEKDLLHARYQEKLDEQDSQFRVQKNKLIDELQQEKKAFSHEQTRRDSERDAALQHIRLQYQEKINILTRQYQNDKKILQESLKAEYESQMEHFRRQHNVKLEQSEIRIKNECNKERDRQIELAIERLEKETRDMKISLQQAADKKLRILKENYETELHDAKENEQSLKSKITTTQERLNNAEHQLEKTEDKLRQCISELNSGKETIIKLISERDNAKKIVRAEIECEKRKLEDKIASLYRELTESNTNRDTLMAQLYSRIKLIITQKDLVIRNISAEASDTKRKCEHLENLLDQQRKEYILKSL